MFIENIYNNKINILRNKIIFLEQKINDFSFKDKNLFKNLYDNYFKINYIVNTLDEWKNNYDNICFLNNEINNNSYIKELALEDLKIYENLNIKIVNKFTKFILEEKKNIGCLFEIRSGTGGDEASIFTEELFKMYYKYLSKNFFNNIEIINKIVNNTYGLKEIIIKINNPDIYNKLKFESGGHRVQRVPNTESQGRIHTSTCTIGVIPIYDDNKFNIILNNNDLRIDTFRSSGAGGQHVNTTNSAIRIVHIPTGITVECQDERSQHKNKSKAINILKSKLISLELEKQRIKNSLIRKKLLGTGFRFDRIRTYNYIDNRIVDHRINLRINKLDEIMYSGNIDMLINPLINHFLSIKIDNLINYDFL